MAHRVMAEEAETFLRRWARLKRERASEESAPATAPAPAGASPAAAGASPATTVEPPELPPIDELTKDSDFTQFLKEGVPEELKRLALRKLWLTDPVFANLDGLLEYGADFGALFRNPGPVATLFRIGRGMPGPGETEEAESTETAEAPETVPAPTQELEPQPRAEVVEDASNSGGDGKVPEDPKNSPSEPSNLSRLGWTG